MTRAEQLEALLKIYRPRVARGNYQADVAHRGGNEVLARVIVALDLETEEGVLAHFRRLDDESWHRDEASLARAVASERERGA